MALSFTCPECGKGFRDARGLGVHRYRMHGVRAKKTPGASKAKGKGKGKLPAQGLAARAEELAAQIEAGAGEEQELRACLLVLLKAVLANRKTAIKTRHELHALRKEAERTLTIDD